MSWLQNIQSELIITTANGEIYKPLNVNATYVTDYQYTEFNFIDVNGSLVIRRRPSGVKYNVEWHFQGPNHLTEISNFRYALDNFTGAIQLEHPLYGIMFVQIVSLTYDDSALNRTKVTGTIIETIEEIRGLKLSKGTFQTAEEFDIVTDPTLYFNLAGIQMYNVTQMLEANNNAFEKGKRIIQKTLDTTNTVFEAYYNAYNSAITAINVATAYPLIAMSRLIDVITMPSKFEAQVNLRMKTLIDTYNNLRSDFFNIVSFVSKEIFSAQTSSTIAAMCNTAMTPLDSDFSLSTNIYIAISQIDAAYHQFLTDVDTLSNKAGNAADAWTANPSLLINLNRMVNNTIASLFDRALNANQERYIICEKDTNAIELAHRLYGLDDADKNVTQLIENNNLAVWEYLQIEKGRKILYYR